jgi:hypothetical protein
MRNGHGRPQKSMTIQYTSRTGKTYYLHAGETKTGKPKYFFSQKQGGAPVDTIPDGFEIYENVEGQVFLRRIPKQIIKSEELALVQAALKSHGEAWEYRAEVKKDMITVYESGTDIGGISDMIAAYTGRPFTEAEKLQHAHYMAVLRFVLEDKKARLFTTERFCFRGSVDDWIHVGGPGPLTDQVGKYIKHVGRESIYELFGGV